MDDTVVAFIARRIATTRAAIRANVPANVDSKKYTQAVNEVAIPTSSLSDYPNMPATVESKKSTMAVNEVTAPPKIGTAVEVAESASSSLFDTIMQMLTPASLRKSSGKTAVSEEQQTIVKEIPKETESESGDMQVDTVFRALLKELKTVDSIAMLQDVEPITNDYERETGNQPSCCSSEQ